jgi:hypothetical protein
MFSKKVKFANLEKLIRFDIHLESGTHFEFQIYFFIIKSQLEHLKNCARCS